MARRQKRNRIGGKETIKYLGRSSNVAFADQSKQTSPKGLIASPTIHANATEPLDDSSSHPYDVSIGYRSLLLIAFLKVCISIQRSSLENQIMAASIERLPNELLFQIFTFLQWSPTRRGYLYTCLFVNRNWHYIAIALLCQYLYIELVGIRH